MKKQRCIIGIFEVFSGIALFLVMAISLTGTKYNIAWHKEMFITVLWVICLTAMAFGLRKAEAFLIHNQKALLSLFCVVWAAALYGFSCFARNQPAADYGIVYNAAMNYVKGVEVEWRYFALWKNNFPLFIVLSLLMKLSGMIGLGDPFYLILACSVAMVLWAGICVFRLIGEAGRAGSWQWMGLILFAGFIPCWGGTQNFYTDAMSICFGVWACSLALKGRKGLYRYYVSAGAVWGIGCAIKATVAISMLAVFLVSALSSHWKQWTKQTVLAMAGFLAVSGGGGEWNRSGACRRVMRWKKRRQCLWSSGWL